jgi:hypothetical protein
MIGVRRLPGIALGVIALALSASLVFAGQPASVGRANGSAHSGKTVPVTQGQGAEPDETDTDETDTDTDESESTDHCNVDLTQDPSVLLTLNHGSVVCTAAHATDWDHELYPTKGAWVSHWAKLNHGHDPNKAHGKP